MEMIGEGDSDVGVDFFFFKREEEVVVTHVLWYPLPSA